MSSTDPHYDNVVLLLPMNGPDNGTTFLDRSKTPKTITNTSKYVKTRTEQFKFYDSCAWFGTIVTAQIVVAAHADFDFGIGDFTIDGWFRTLAAKANIVLIKKDTESTSSFNQNGNWALELNSSTAEGNIQFRIREGGSVQTLLSGGSLLLDDAWHHFELNHHGEDWGLYIDGTLVDDATYAGNISSLSRPVLIGGNAYGNWSMMGYMQDVRITKGVARHTANFTPPTRGAWVQKFIRGIIKDATGTPCERIVRAYRRDTGAFVAEALSDAVTGEYELESFHDGEHQRIVLDDAAGTLYNDLIDRVVSGP